MKPNKFTLLIFLFIFSQTVIASDFIVEVSSTKQTTNPCTSVQFSLKITNTGIYADTYGLKAEEFPNYVTVSESSFNLNPGDSKQLFAYANFPCGVYGKQSFDLLIKSTSSDIKASVPLIVDILRAYDYSISTLKSYEICELLNSTVALTIKNKADVINSYTLSVKGADFATPRETIVSLAAGQEADILLNLKPEQGSAGSYDLTIISKSTRGEITKKLTTTINVSQCLNPVVTVPTDKSVCTEESSFLFEAVNNGIFEETFNFEVRPDFITLEEQSITLTPGESKLLTLTINPSAENNDYTVMLNTTLSDRPVSFSQSFNLRVFSPETCYKAYLQKHRLSVNYGEETNNLLLVSSGFRYSNYDLSYSGPSWASVKPSSFLLEPNHNKLLQITTNALNDTLPGIYQLNISLEADNGFVYQESVRLKLGQTLELDQVLLMMLISLVAFFALIILILLLKPKKKDKPLKEYIKTEKKTSKAKYKTLLKFLRVFLGAVIFGLVIFGLVNYLPTSPQVVNVTEPEPPVEEVVEIIELVNVTVNETTYDFTLQLSTYTEWINITGFMNYLNGYTKEISIGILALFTLLVAIGIFLSLKNKKILFVLLALLILFSLSSQVELSQLFENGTVVEEKGLEEVQEVVEESVVINTSMYDDLKSTFLYHEFEKNTIYEINLSEFFFDPEGEQLIFTTTNPTNIVASVFDDILLFSPQLDWTGINSMAVIATDNQGAMTTSPEIILVVVEDKPLSFTEFEEWVKTNIDLILFTLILFVIFIIIVINSSSKK